MVCVNGALVLPFLSVKDRNHWETFEAPTNFVGHFTVRGQNRPLLHQRLTKSLVKLVLFLCTFIAAIPTISRNEYINDELDPLFDHLPKEKTQTFSVSQA
jgi:hypothetical protein